MVVVGLSRRSVLAVVSLAAESDLPNWKEWRLFCLKTPKLDSSEVCSTREETLCTLVAHKAVQEAGWCCVLLFSSPVLEMMEVATAW